MTWKGGYICTYDKLYVYDIHDVPEVGIWPGYQWKLVDH